jgi:hypothetical protein
MRKSLKYNRLILTSVTHRARVEERHVVCLCIHTLCSIYTLFCVYIHSVQNVSIPQTYVLNPYHNSLPICIKFYTLLGKWSLRNRVKFYVIRCSGCKDVTSQRYARRMCRNARCMTFNQRSRYHVTFATSHLCNQSTESRKIWYDYVNFSCRVVCMKFYKNW